MLVNVNADADHDPTLAPASPDYASLDQFLASVGPRAFRFAELGLRQREDSLDAVQDAMMKMVNYRDRPSTDGRHCSGASCAAA